MILLETSNRVVADVMKTIMFPDAHVTPNAFNANICDFDDTFCVNVPLEDTSCIQISLKVACYSQIKDMGAAEAMKAIFGSFLLDTPLEGFDFTVSMKQAEYAGREQEYIDKVSGMKSVVHGAVFEKYFKALNDKTISSLPNFKFNLRGDTTVYIVPQADRIYTTFQLSFQDKTDSEIGKVFLAEFADPAQRRKAQRAPIVNFDISPPSHLKAFGVETANKSDLGFVSFTLLEMHVVDGTRQKAVDCMQSFRYLIQYHIKAAKSYFHSRMRGRVVELVKVLNRAKTTDNNQQPKRITTAAGKVLIR